MTRSNVMAMGGSRKLKNYKVTYKVQGEDLPITTEVTARSKREAEKAIGMRTDYKAYDLRIVGPY